MVKNIFWAKLFSIILLCLIISINILFLFHKNYFYLLFSLPTFIFMVLVKIFLLKIKILHKKEKTHQIVEKSVNIKQHNSFNKIQKEKAYEIKYKDLLINFGELMENMEKNFHKTNDVHLFTALEADNIQKETQEIQEIFKEIEQINKNGEVISNEIKQISNESLLVKDETEQSSHKIKNTQQVMSEIKKSNESLKNSIDVFVKDTREIEKMLSFINKITSRTRILSINAAIEASRFGESGSGFHVLSKEIRKLADHTSKYTKNINMLINSLKNNSENVLTSMNLNSHNINEGINFLDKSSHSMNSLTNKMISIDKMIQNINSGLGNSIDKIKNSHQLIGSLQKSSGETKNNTTHLSGLANQLSVLGESTINKILHIPSKNQISRFTRIIFKIRLEIEKTIEQIILNNELNIDDLFEPEFVEIEEHKDRFACKYQPLLLKRIQPIVEDYKVLVPGILNIIIIDFKRYCSVSSKLFCQPYTGDYVTDAKNNFVQKFYHLDKVDELNNAVNDRDFYLTSYPLKEFKLTISDLVFPIYIKEKRWGTGRVGFNPDQLKLN